MEDINKYLNYLAEKFKEKWIDEVLKQRVKAVYLNSLTAFKVAFIKRKIHNMKIIGQWILLKIEEKKKMLEGENQSVNQIKEKILNAFTKELLA